MLTEVGWQALWGDLFEVAVKRGCLALLRERGPLGRRHDPWHAHLDEWRSLAVDDLHRHVARQTGAIDPRERAMLASSLEHLLLQGWGLGWTALRAYLRRFGGETLEVAGLYCPLSLQDRRQDAREVAPPHAAEQAARLWQALGLEGAADPVTAGRGEPANADLLLLLRAGERLHALCVEVSLHATPGLEDFSTEEAHLTELEQHVRRVESRGVFTRISAEVAGEQFRFSDAVIAHLGALTTPDKPLYKLCQGSAYATRLLDVLARHSAHPAPDTVQVMAVTNSGVEALCAAVGPGAGGAADGFADPRARLMVALGDAYRRMARGAEDQRPEDDASLDREIAAVQGAIARSLPDALRGPFEEAFAVPASTREVDVRLQEAIDGFANPAGTVGREEALAWVADAPEAAAPLLGGAVREQIGAELDRVTRDASAVSLRDLHQAAMLAGLRAAQLGKITVIAAEGHPGIGKTTAVLEHLRRIPPAEGFLFFYASPRTVINSEVTQKAAHAAPGAPPVLALTTNARLIRSAARWHWEQTRQQTTRRYVDSAVVVDGAPGLRHPTGSTVFLDVQQAQALDEDFAATGFRKQTVHERVDDLRAERAPGVLLTLARAARGCLEENKKVNRVALTAAVQGLRAGGQTGAAEAGTSTVDRLSELFRSRADTPRGVQERRAFAARIPTVVAMVDEIAGDGAGAPFVHALAAWLDREFIRPFSGVGQASPFRVVLVLADASLANEVVLASYLGHGRGAPEKVIVSDSRGPRPFRLAAGTLRLAGRTLPALHVMADGFPARTLTTEYLVRLSPVLRRLRPDGSTASARAAILEEHGQAQLRLAAEEAFRALSAVPPGQQVILFAQDKQFLRDLSKGLVNPAAIQHEGIAIETYGQQVTAEEIGLLDSSVPEGQRRRLLQEEERDSKRLFLMTSSGARGVSFPRVATLIAFVPRFAIESGFMEIAQLIYRGRGATRDPATGAVWDGDTLDRRLVLLLQDFVLADEPIDSRQWLRRTIDLVSALVLLRATIFTRITGDAGIPGQRAAIVPVGRIAVEDTTVSLTQSIASFLREGRIALHDDLHAAARQLVDGAVRDVQDAFRDLQWTGMPYDPRRRSIAVPELLGSLTRTVCSPLAPLLDDARAVALPEETFAVGPLWIERWSDVSAEEAFTFNGLGAVERTRLKRLVEGCHDIGRRRELPGPLRRAARDVEAILRRPDDLLGISFVARKAVESDRVWICLPVDYERFCTLPGGEENAGASFRLVQPELWLDALVRVGFANASVAATHPALPSFESRPFVALMTQGDPTGLDRAFDDRYFMASSELNLLNTILFVRDGSGSDGI